MAIDQEKPIDKSKKLLLIPIILVTLIVLLLTFIIIARVFTPEDTWVCQSGEWVKHGNPESGPPTLECRKTKNEATDAGNTSEGDKSIPNINPVGAAHDAVNALPAENPIGPVEIKGFFAFMSPVIDIMADFGARVCEWGRSPEVANNCPSIKIKFQEFFESQSR